MTEERDPEAVEIGQRLRQARSHLGLNGEAMAASMDVPYRTYQRYELGEGTPKVATLRKLKAQGISLDWLISGGGPMLGYTQATRPQSEGLRETDASLLGRIIDAVQRLYSEENQRLAPINQGAVVGPIYDVVSALEGRAEQDAAMKIALDFHRSQLRAAAANPADSRKLQA